MISKKFKVETVWISYNAFCVEVIEYKRIPRFILKDKWEEVTSYRYASWETFIEIMWQKHMLSGESLWEIDTKI